VSTSPGTEDSPTADDAGSATADVGSATPDADAATADAAADQPAGTTSSGSSVPAPAGVPGPRPPAVAPRRTTVHTVIGAVLVLAFAVTVAVGIHHTPARPADGAHPTPWPAAPPVAGPQAPIPGVALPAGATASGIMLGKADARVAIDVYIDFQCPYCRQFELASGPTLDQLVTSGQARVTYHPLSFFDRFSSTRYSSRAAAAAGCAIDARVYPRFQTLMFEQQPPEGGVGLPDDRIIALGRQAGAGDQFDRCVRDRRYAPWVSTITAQATRDGVDSTPDLLVNGEGIEHTDEALRSAVRSAAG
jgi:protein-disulfide isomerase